MIKTNCKLQNANFKSQILIPLNFAFFILIFTFCIVTEAHAHRVNIYAYAEDGMIHSESYFVDGTKCKNSLVEVFDERGAKLLEGTTDDNGKFSFKIPRATSLRLVLRASMGHQAEYVLTKDEVIASMDIKVQKPEVQSQRPNTPLPPFPKGGRGGITPEPQILNTEIEEVVEKVMDKKLRPVIEQLAELRKDTKRPGMTEIIGGIGYIIGIMGIIMYFKRRRKD